MVAHGSVVPRTIEVGAVPFATGYVEGVAALPDRRGEGLGTLAMEALDGHIRTHTELGVLGTGAYRFVPRQDTTYRRGL